MAFQNSVGVDPLCSTIDRPHPAKVTPHAVATHRAASRLINHVQVLVHQVPPAVHYLERTAYRLRPASPLYLAYPPEKDTAPMTPPNESANAEARESAQRLIDFIQVFTPTRPRVVRAAEQFLTEVVADEARHRIWNRLQRLSADSIAKLDAESAQLEQEDAARRATDD